MTGELGAALSEAVNSSSGKGKSKLGKLNTDAINEDVVTALTEYLKDIEYLKFGDVSALPEDPTVEGADGSHEEGEGVN